MDFGGSMEKVVERTDYPKEKLDEIFGEDTFGMLGYGTQGRGQALNLRDNGMKVIVGVREGGKSWDLAKEDGFVPGETLMPILDAAEQSSIVMYLLSDAGQKEFWPQLKPKITSGKTLYFSHGFSVVFKDDTGVVRCVRVFVTIECVTYTTRTSLVSLTLITARKSTRS